VSSSFLFASGSYYRLKRSDKVLVMVQQSIRAQVKNHKWKDTRCCILDSRFSMLDAGDGKQRTEEKDTEYGDAEDEGGGQKMECERST